MRNLVLFLHILLLIFFASCSDEKDKSSIPKNDEALVEVSFIMPSTRVPDIGDIETGTNEERNINTLDLLIFKNNEFQYRRYATKFGTDATRFRATLKVDDNVTVYFIANSRSLIEDLISSGQLTDDSLESWETIRALLIDENPARFTTMDSELSNLPMWATKDGLNITSDVITYWTGISLLRAVAGVDIYLSAGVSNFTLSDARLYFVPDKGSLAPLDNYDPSTGIAVSKSAPDMTTSLTLGPIAAANNNVANKFYLYDNDTEASTFVAEGATIRRYTRAIVGGIYNTNTYYYPIDFIAVDDNGIATYEKIARNEKYILEIIEVSGPGYPTPEIASQEPPVHMTTNIYNWNVNGDTEAGYDGIYYVSLERRKATLGRSANSVDYIKMTSNARYDIITLNFDDTSTNGDQTAITNGIQNDRFSVEMVLAPDGIYIEQLKFTSLGEYSVDTASRNSDIVILQAGNIRFQITINQLNNDPNDWESGSNDNVELDNN